MRVKYRKILIAALLSAFALAFYVGPVLADWVPDDDGNLHWWEPPKEPIYKIESNPILSGQCNAQVLFMMDTSGSMSDEFDVLCNKIDDIVQGLQDGGITIDYEILGINATRSCASGTVSGSVPNPTVNHIEDWGPAVEDVAEQYNWKSGYVRIAIPMSDEGAENGDNWTSADDDAIDRAKKAAKTNSVGVIPVIGTPWQQSQYAYIKAGAEELADYCWGTVFLSTDPTDDLVDGIISAINDLCTPTSDKVGVNVYVDDAFADAGTKGYVNKIPGDIAFLVAQVTNGSGQDFTGDLKISYLATWDLVDHDEVMRRKKGEPWIEEPCTETVDNSTPGEVIIKGIPLTKDDVSTPNENEGKTCEYVVKVIIPTSQIANMCVSVNAEVNPSDGSDPFQTASDSFEVSINSVGDMILTNRNLLFERHADKKKVLDILKEIQKIALERSAVLFYVDWWDEYDDFSGINPEGTGSTEASRPIKNWDRSADIDYTSETTANEKVCAPIDKYTHYWAESLGGIDKKHYLLIVGGDDIIPFYRYYPNPLDTWLSVTSLSSFYNASEYTEKAAQEGCIYSDIIYADTKGDELTPDEIFPARMVNYNAEQLLQNLVNSDYSNRVAQNASISMALNPSNIDFYKRAEKIKKRFEDVGYIVNKEMGDSLINENRSFNFDDDLKPEFENPFDILFHNGHGHTTRADDRFDGSDFDRSINGIPLSALFARYKPHFIIESCLVGQADRTETQKRSTLMVYSLVRSNVPDVLGPTAVMHPMTGDNLYGDYIKGITGARLGSNSSPKTIGEALNDAKKMWWRWHPIDIASVTLYGTPWHKYSPPGARQKTTSMLLADTYIRSTPSAKAVNITKIMGTTSKTIQETIDSYSIEQEAGFDFIKIDGYKRLEKGEDTPVLPVKRLYITLPKDATLNSVDVTTGNEVNLGSLNIPVTNDAPPMPDSGYTYYLTGPEAIGLFDDFYDSFTYTTQDNKVLVLDLFPVSYDTVSDEAKLYKDVEINVSYDTNKKGVLLEAFPEKQSYSSGETINVSISIENIIDQSTQFDILVELNDRLQNTVQSQTSSITIDPAYIGQTTVQLQAPSKGGSYWVNTSVSDGTQEIGTSSEHINVNPGDITGIVVPRCIPGGTADFTVTFHNSSDTEVEAAIGLSIYEGSTPVAEFIPVVYTVSADSDQDATFTWEIPSDFPGGNYLAVATATVGEYTSSLSEEFGIGGLDIGWNLISLPLEPDDTAIESVLNPIEGKYYIVWAYDNGAWFSYNPDAPAFSDLSEMSAGEGYWINLKIAANFCASGSEPGKSVSLSSNWNLVGYNSTASLSIEEALASIDGKYVSVWAFIDGDWKVYDPANHGASDLVTMDPGFGYWINTTEACIWTLP
jgi:hypothetical protein